MTGKICKHLYPVLDAMIAESVEQVSRSGGCVSCRAGCSDCCSLLVEVSWEEASHLAMFIKGMEKSRRQHFCRKIRLNAEEARRVFAERAETHKYMAPYGGDFGMPDEAYDDYFYGSERPCPFLEDRCCSVYKVRPSACRLHMVSSPPEFCSRVERDEEKFIIPEEVEDLKEACSPMLAAIEKDGRWGQMAIMVEAALEDIALEEEILKITSDRSRAAWG